MNDTQVTLQKSDVAELANQYFWWKEAFYDQNHIGVSVYGGWLLSMQDRLGVEIVDRDDLVRSIERARELAND